MNDNTKPGTRQGALIAKWAREIASSCFVPTIADMLLRLAPTIEDAGRLWDKQNEGAGMSGMNDSAPASCSIQRCDGCQHFLPSKIYMAMGRCTRVEVVPFWVRGNSGVFRNEGAGCAAFKPNSPAGPTSSEATHE